jgi:hypothetical protein
MRFAAVNVPKQQPQRTSATELLIRRIALGEPLPPAQPAPVRQQDLPADLDQRVRLVGEW